MKIARLLHNPDAGGGEITKKELLSDIRSAGFDCSYSSTKEKGWEKIEPKELDFLILAGGDGTVRKVAEELLDRKLLDKKLPIGLLPMGTANNIARTLGISGKKEEIIEAWTEWNIKKYDVGKIYGLARAKFFLEGLGYGVFPHLMEEMKKPERKEDGTAKDMDTALEQLHEIILSYKARHCTIEADGVDHSGKFLLVEIMNTNSIGPNLHIAPFADPGDGELEVVLITERQREDFAAYVQKKIKGEDVPSFFNILKAKKIKIHWEGTYVHVDDENFLMDEPAEVKIELQDGLLEFLIPKEKKVDS
jgi:diacylglycerol kinase family enzyme